MTERDGPTQFRLNHGQQAYPAGTPKEEIEFHTAKHEMDKATKTLGYVQGRRHRYVAKIGTEAADYDFEYRALKAAETDATERLHEAQRRYWAADDAYLYPGIPARKAVLLEDAENLAEAHIEEEADQP